MNRPKLHEIPLSHVTLGPGTLLFTMSVGQWDNLLAAAYQQGHTLLELDDNEQPVAAYRRCGCDICRQGHELGPRSNKAAQAKRSARRGPTWRDRPPPPPGGI